MIGPVVERDTYIDHGIPSQETFIKCRTHSFLDRRNILTRDRTALDLVGELKPFTTRERFDTNPGIAKLSTSTALLLQPPLGIRLARNRFTVRHFGGFEI